MPRLFSSGKKIVIGVVHLAPLPGAPRFAGDIEQVIQRALSDARAYAQGGADALCIENFGDIPFTRGRVGPETVAAMSAAGRAIRAAVRLPTGFNVLRNDPLAGLALCAACRGGFVRVNVHCGAMITDQGIIEGNAFETLRYRRRICPEALILADVHVKHAVPVGDMPLEIAARDTVERGLADALIVSGTGTGASADVTEVKRVRQACPKAKILIGSGITVENVWRYLDDADGVIVGTSVKRGGKVENPVDPRRVAQLVRRMKP
ncbi:MAG TPA: BtpA/SgcQ family protein [Verrucomicrobia bacterium]|nr:BtpA/SgcQ family protein [Verrucomicrobiota bacterium]HOB31483.1 BtpA/SgcQ family protein [Verrucomicrobiota bacterium]HOP98225.1 BtpA/SgcQ family protein [Verrucomicrobiota bacterium]HPU56982.1 BtpA/SgcQ family protein [Verrucomicrobiota bacterium]